MPLLSMVRIVVIAESDVEARAPAAPAYALLFETFTFLSRTRNLPLPPNPPKSFEDAWTTVSAWSDHHPRCDKREAGC
jgi:hypothetical protein